MKAVELEKNFNPREFEDRIYAAWEAGGYFKPRDGEGDPYVIVIPPPNVTGVLHLGHGLNNSLQDLLIRYNRMLGKPTLWVPGTDHAGIATQNIVEKQLRAKGVDRRDIGRDAFIDETWKVTHEHHKIISTQLRRIGASCDWSRERFTFDEGLSRTVSHVFVDLYKKGLIYRGTYLVNWSVGMQSAISDDEVEFKEVKGKLYHLVYPLSDGSGEVRVATTRPETMLGDTAVAVHPDDERYKHLIGKTVDLPLTGRKIPVIADTYVDKEFGTGIVKITPAHDPNDWEMGKRHSLEAINIMNPDGTLNERVPADYRGLKMQEARKKVVADLEAGGFFAGDEPHTHQVGHCYRTDTVIEPFLSEQWFVRMQPLAELALKALETGGIVFHPKKWENTYRNWMNSIRDWCISRQLWWGHRIPVWYDDETGDVIVSETDPTSLPENAGRKLRQDEDVLDTWFSSWLWPFSVFGWPEKNADLDRFYPTTTLVSAYDIIFFWISRMVMAGMEFTGRPPFRDIYITGLVRDKKGRKMSKSLGNGLDPLEIVDEYGADALKFTLAFLATQGQDILLDKETFGIGSRFANKIWNASRYLLMNIDGCELLPLSSLQTAARLDFVDKWMLHRLNETAGLVRRAMDDFRFNEASSGVYEFFWNEFCDWYIEAAKLSTSAGDQDERNRKVSLLLYILEEALALLHPFLSFVTEEIYQKLPGKREGMLIARAFPAPEDWRAFPEDAASFAWLQDIIRQVRTVRSEFTIPPGAKFGARLYVEAGKLAYARGAEALIRLLCGIDSLAIEGPRSGDRPARTLACAGAGFEAFLEIRDIIDIDAAVQRFSKAREKEGASLAQIEARLANKAFVENAKPEYVEAERARAAQIRDILGKYETYISDLVG